MNHYYEKMGEDGNPVRCPTYDYDGAVTGKIVINAPAYFDENPAEARRLGWTKHITLNRNEIRERYHYDAQTQYLLRSVRRIDDYTVEDVYHVVDKSEEMLQLEELTQGMTSLLGEDSGIVFFNDEGM